MIKDLFCNPQTGKISHSKMWANVACAVATYKFVVTPDLVAEIWFAYLGLVGGYAAARRWIASKQVNDNNVNNRSPYYRPPTMTNQNNRKRNNDDVDNG